jgi:Tfp pilus assembly protein PilN
VRPVNLIPPDQRKGAARAAGADTSPVGVYVFFGVLGVVFLCLLALVLTSNQINSKTEEVSKVQAQEQGAKQVADALRPYGTFAQVQQARKLEISTLASTRFNWERSLRQLSRAIPDDVWLLNLSGTLTPQIEVDDSGGGGDVATLRQKANAPAYALTGCTNSQHSVARMMTRMQNLDDVTDVELSKSAKKDEQDSGAGAAAGVAGAAGTSSTEDAQDCIGGKNITKFDMLVVFGAAPGAQADTSVPVDPSSANSTAQAIASAQGAAATAQGASAAAGATVPPGATPAGGTP